MDNCKEAINRLNQYLDRELNDEEQQIVRRHLEHCPPCLDLFRFEENVLTFIGERCRQTMAPPSLRDKVQKLCQHD
jgi:mycothiol system anti-sigma-R factor